MNNETHLWYHKVNGRIKGPYTTGLISKNILLGRIHSSDLLSQDKNIWRKASSIREVMPDVIKQRNQPNYTERLKAAKRWADERETLRELSDDGQEKHYEPRKKVTYLRIKTTGIFGVFSIVTIISGLIYAMFMFTPDDPLAKINCSVQGREGIIFDGCHLQRKNFSNLSLKGSSFKNALLQSAQFKQSSLQSSNLDYANLSHADLSLANLTGASLRAADLRGALLNAANFTKADLSYADLTGAEASKAKLTGTILSNTIWFDGSICHKESIGRCKR